MNDYLCVAFKSDDGWHIWVSETVVCFVYGPFETLLEAEWFVELAYFTELANVEK